MTTQAHTDEKTTEIKTSSKHIPPIQVYLITSKERKPILTEEGEGNEIHSVYVNPEKGS